MQSPGDIGEALKALGGIGLPGGAMAKLQADYLAGAMAVWNRVLLPAGAPAGTPDRRFAASEWSATPGSAFLAEMYLLNARTLLGMADELQADEKTKARVRFAVLQWIDAASPSNYLALNPEAQKKAIETQGESLAVGMRQLWHDVQQGHLSQTDESAFEVGRNVATTEGSVVFENEFFQLLEYKPLTAKVYERPLLIVPPCINKFYILDLQPENSLIRYAVGEGHRVFVVSWKNAKEDLAQRTWDDYIENAAIRAIGLAQEISGSKEINTLGFCIGGTILATALAVLEARGERPAASMTLLTSFLDFSDTGILDIFIDEGSVKMREMTIGAESAGGGSLLKGQELATTFSFLRPNDLVWNYVVGNYLKGETPPPFDLLYWNGDGTNLPGPMYCWYLRNTYLENKLKEPGALTVCGEKIDLSKITAPAYLYASREDHIVPWAGAYRSTAILKGKRRFVLGASGHIAGVINPPLKKKRSHWIGKTAALPATAEAWLAQAEEHPGSWWTDWSNWLKPFGGKQVAAPKAPGSRKWKAIEPAPGRYVKEKA
ncbi:MAG: class I poly(R)-hydroxyalkanoic acid synthase [Burkholderiales bacterium]|nr:class I poly(R)-hydroxyalkanoic acid synthase [Burkholderiales bacterium]